MITIFKYPFNLIGTQAIKMPSGAKILDVQSQVDIPCVWVMVDTAHEMEIRHFEAFATGVDISGDAAKQIHYIGTFQMYNGMYVYHLFEIKK